MPGGRQRVTCRLVDQQVLLLCLAGRVCCRCVFVTRVAVRPLCGSGSDCRRCLSRQGWLFVVLYLAIRVVSMFCLCAVAYQCE